MTLYNTNVLTVAREAEHVGKNVSYLEDFDLAAGRVDMLHVFLVFVGSEGVHLDTEGHPFLPAMLPRGELSADAVDLRTSDKRGFKEGINIFPETRDQNLSVPG